MHIAPGLRLGGLRALEGARSPDPHAGRRGRPLLRRLRVAARALDGGGEGSDHRRPARARASSSRPARSSIATRSAGAARRRSSSASPTTGSSPPTRSGRALLEANTSVDWVPEHFGKRMDDWLREHGRLEHLAEALLRAAAAVLPVLAAGTLNVIGSLAELRETGDCGLDQLEELHRPWIDEVRDPLRRLRRGGRARRRGRRRLARRRHRPVLHPRLEERGVGRGRERDRRRTRADDGRSPRPRLLGDVVPGRLGLRDAGADPALVLRAALHVGDAGRPRCRTGRCSPTRSCSTRPAARCTAASATRSTPTRRSSGWAPT